MDTQIPSMSASSSPAGMASGLDGTVRLAPIALFVYNRPEHTRKTVESLRANHLAKESELFVFADGSKNEADATRVAEVRKYVRNIEGFRSVTIVERARNLGLSNSVISGVSQVMKAFDCTIAVEDDLLTTPDFLTFMNQTLNRYKDERRIFSVSGFNFAVQAPENYPYDAFCSYRSSSWGWGTWRNRWEKADWNVSDYSKFCADKDKQRSFKRGGEDLVRMLGLQMAGRIDSWAIRWAYAHWAHDAFAVLPVGSRVFNIGLDGSGVHCRRSSARQSPLNPGSESELRFPLIIDPDEQFTAPIYRMHRTSLLWKCARFFYRSITNRRRRRQVQVDRTRIPTPNGA